MSFKGIFKIYYFYYRLHNTWFGWHYLCLWYLIIKPSMQKKNKMLSKSQAITQRRKAVKMIEADQSKNGCSPCSIHCVRLMPKPLIK